jgi:lipopolysaccharide export system permease protein
MKILQRYILGELLKVFVLLLSVLTVMLVFVGVFREAQENGLGTAQILQVLPFIIPSLMPYTIPATLLLSVCVVFGRLSGDQEVIATKSAGINPLSLLLPAFLLAGCLVGGSWMLTDRMIPWAMTQMQQKISDALEDIFLDRLKSTHLITDPAQGYSIFVKDVRGKTLIHPTFQYSPRGHSTTTLQAQEATIKFDLERQVVLLNLVNCQIDAPGETTLFVTRESREFPLSQDAVDTKPRHLELSSIRKHLQKKRNEIEQRGLKRDIRAAFALGIGDFDLITSNRFREADRANDRTQISINKMNAEIHSRFALSASCLFFVFLGAPYSISQGKSQFLTTFFVCFMPILLLYYPVVLLVLTLSKSGDVDPAWAMWIPNVILLAAGSVILRRVVKY